MNQSQTKPVTSSFNALPPATADLLPEGKRIAFIYSCWHADLVEQCRDGFIESIEQQGINAASIDVFTVPGGLEIPLQAQLLAKTGRYAAIVASGLIVDGGIYRHEFVADAIIKAFMDVQLAFELPVISAVLTPQHFHEHDVHNEFFYKHLRTKGAEAANACAQMLGNVKMIRAL